MTAEDGGMVWLASSTNARLECLGWIVGGALRQLYLPANSESSWIGSG